MQRQPSSHLECEKIFPHAGVLCESSGKPGMPAGGAAAGKSENIIYYMV